MTFAGILHLHEIPICPSCGHTNLTPILISNPHHHYSCPSPTCLQHWQFLCDTIRTDVPLDADYHNQERTITETLAQFDRLDADIGYAPTLERPYRNPHSFIWEYIQPPKDINNNENDDGLLQAFGGLTVKKDVEDDICGKLADMDIKYDKNREDETEKHTMMSMEEWEDNYDYIVQDGAEYWNEPKSEKKKEEEWVEKNVYYDEDGKSRAEGYRTVIEGTGAAEYIWNPPAPYDICDGMKYFQIK